MIRVDCTLADCIHYNKPTDPDVPEGRCDCAHPDKEMYLTNVTCPLYRRDWGKLHPGVVNMRDRFETKKKKKRLF